MKTKTKQLLDIAYEHCVELGKSMEYIIEYLQDFAEVNLDCVINYLFKYRGQ